MSSPPPDVSARRYRRFTLMIATLVCVVVALAGFGTWWWHGQGASHLTPQTTAATLAANTCAHAVATEPRAATWIPLTSTAPSDVAATMEPDGLAMMESRLGPLTLDTPALVYPLNIHTGYDANDCPHWVASFHYNRDNGWGTLDYVYDPLHEQIRFSNGGGIYQGDSRFGKAFPYVTLDQALALVRQRHGVSPSKTDAPMLVFFAPKQGWAGGGQPDRTATHFWTDSGTAATDPMWRIAGADGKVYFVGRSQHVYAASEVPMA
jgi:hypothetical protein